MSAAQLQAEAADLAREQQQAQFETTQEQFKPFQQAGVRALDQQQLLLGLRGVPEQEQALREFRVSPGQAFLRQRGEQALLRQSAAIGGLGGGQVRSELQQQGIGFAQQDLQNQLARLGSIAGQGQAATSNVAGFGAQAAGQMGQLGMQGAQAQAQGILGARAIQQAHEQRVTGLATSGLAGATQGAQTQGMTAGQGATAGIIGKL
jgi:hypothetical protein